MGKKRIGEVFIIIMIIFTMIFTATVTSVGKSQKQITNKTTDKLYTVIKEYNFEGKNLELNWAMGRFHGGLVHIEEEIEKPLRGAENMWYVLFPKIGTKNSGTVRH